MATFVKRNGKLSATRIMVLALMVVIVMTEGARGANYCSDQTEALTMVMPCVAAGSLQTKPTSKCCAGVKLLVSKVSINCFCEILISVAGPSTPSLLNTYATTCSLSIPPKYVCIL